MSYNTREIMQTAWTKYRRWFQVRNRFFRFNASDFSVYLAAAWRAAREANYTPKQARAAAIERELSRLPYAPAHVNVAAKRAKLETELRGL